MQIPGMRGAASVTAGTLWHHLQLGDRRPQRDARVQACLGTEPRWERETPRDGHGWREGSFSQEGAGAQSIQTWRGTPYHSVLGLGEVNEIRLLPPALLLPLVEAICQDHAALALEESTLGERKHKRGVKSSPEQAAREDRGRWDHPAPPLPPGAPLCCPTGRTNATTSAGMKGELHQQQPFQFFYFNEIRQLRSAGTELPSAAGGRYSLGRGFGSGFADYASSSSWTQRQQQLTL